VKRVPREEWNRHSVREVLQPCSPENTIRLDADGINVLAQISSGQSPLMVVDRQHLLDVIDLKDLMGFLATKLDIEGTSCPIHQREESESDPCWGMNFRGNRGRGGDGRPRPYATGGARR
jgi:hypothetical protein